MKRFLFAQTVALWLWPAAASGSTLFAQGELRIPSNANQNGFLVKTLDFSSANGVNEFTGASGGLILGPEFSPFEGTATSGAASIAASGQVAALHASATVAGTNVPLLAPFGGLPDQAFATASYWDMMTFDKAGLTGTAGTVKLTFDVHGTLDALGPLAFSAGIFVFNGRQLVSPLGHASDAAIDAGSLNVGFFVINSKDGTIAVQGTAQGEKFTTVPLSIVYGTPHEVSAFLEAGAYLCGLCSNATPQQLVSGSASADFSNTATLSSIELRDANGNLVNGASIMGTNGFDYNAFLSGDAAAVPEPATGLLIGAALLLAVFRLRGREV